MEPEPFRSAASKLIAYKCEKASGRVRAEVQADEKCHGQAEVSDHGQGFGASDCCSFRVKRKSRLRSSGEGLRMDWKTRGVKIVHANELDLNTPQTAGMTRAAAITHAKTGANTLWAGTMLVQPDAKTGPHHHGELETVLYVLRGRVRMRWGDQLEFIDEASAGDFIYVPPYVPHQEINADPNNSCEAVVVRNGQEPVVVNLDLQTPEPASAGRPGMPFHPDR
jgi:uncharacterized RmlC-like cupin family protein